jgi:hypothetical protein
MSEKTTVTLPTEAYIEAELRLARLMEPHRTWRSDSQGAYFMDTSDGDNFEREYSPLWARDAGAALTLGIMLKIGVNFPNKVPEVEATFWHPMESWSLIGQTYAEHGDNELLATCYVLTLAAITLQEALAAAGKHH